MSSIALQLDPMADMSALFDSLTAGVRDIIGGIELPKVPKRRRTKTRAIGFSKVTYKPTPCGWVEPRISNPLMSLPCCAKDGSDILSRLVKQGARLGATVDGYVSYTTPEGTTGKVKLAIRGVG